MGSVAMHMAMQMTIFLRFDSTLSGNISSRRPKVAYAILKKKSMVVIRQHAIADGKDIVFCVRDRTIKAIRSIARPGTIASRLMLTARNTVVGKDAMIAYNIFPFGRITIAASSRQRARIKFISRAA